jgi:mitochondrial enoyl-[acyl-carrier protein] reductase / trans-2-enoyl-CoA reductase
MGKLNDNSLLLEFLCSPINPSDINQIQGVYPIKPEVPGALAGNEGLARVIQVGKSLSNSWKVGDRVIPLKPCFGTWRTYAIAEANQLMKVPKNIPSIQAATMSVNLCSAYRMLKDFNPPNNCVIQNAANSGVGRYVIQLCKALGMPSVNIIRNRPGVNDLIYELKDLGATYVLLQEDLAKAETRKWFKDSFPSGFGLALNAVGGPSSLELARNLSEGGSLVTYGAMSREPTAVPASLFIFKDIRLRGFWMGRWKEKCIDLEVYYQMINELADLTSQSKIVGPPVKFIDFDLGKLADEDSTKLFHEAISEAQKPFTNNKIMLRFNKDIV